MHILVTNDDGIQSNGLLALVQAVSRFGEVSVLAPDRNWSSCGHVKTLSKPLRIYKTILGDGSEAYTCDGSPTDCVALACIGALEKRFDLVVSGINTSANLGNDVTYSGTVTAAMEATLQGVRGIAFSQGHAIDIAQDYAVSQKVAEIVIQKFIEKPFPKETFISVNTPNVTPDELKGIKMTRQGKRIYYDKLEMRTDPRGGRYYWIAGERPGGENENGTDIGALADGYASVTPFQLDLTDHSLLDSWEF